MMRSIRSVVAGIAVLISAAPTWAAEDFQPQLQKLVVDGQVLYEAGAKETKPVLVDSATPTRFECTFVNKGGKPGEDPFMVFVHVADGDNVVGGDYSPTTPTTSWAKDRPVVDTKNIDLSALKFKQVQVFVGLYHGADRISLINPGLDYQQRLPVGIMYINRLPPGGDPKEGKP